MLLPLAPFGAQRHSAYMLKAFFVTFAMCCAVVSVTAPPLNAQTVDPDSIPLPDIAPLPDAPNGALPPEGDDESLDEAAQNARPDVFILSPEDRILQLDELFGRLKREKDPKTAELIAEEIWAIWLQSGSPSIDLLLRRGVAAQIAGDLPKARRLFEHVIRLHPDYAEGWARSARLALEQGRVADAQADTVQALILEPRHFYALWTLGNILERTGQPAAAFETYSEALALYPALEQVEKRVTALRGEAEGQPL